MPSLNMLLKSYSNELHRRDKDEDALKKLSTFKVGPFYIKKSVFYKGLRLALTQNGVAVEEFDHPTEDEVKNIFLFKASLRERAQSPIDFDTKGIALVGMDKFPFKEMTGVVSPIVTETLEAIIFRDNSKLAPVEYVRDALKDISVILVPNRIAIKNKMMSYVVSLGLDIEIIGLDEKGETDIARLNSHRAPKARKDKRGKKQWTVKFDSPKSISKEERKKISASISNILGLSELGLSIREVKV